MIALNYTMYKQQNLCIPHTKWNETKTRRKKNERYFLTPVDPKQRAKYLFMQIVSTTIFQSQATLWALNSILWWQGTLRWIGMACNCIVCSFLGEWVVECIQGKFDTDFMSFIFMHIYTHTLRWQPTKNIKYLLTKERAFCHRQQWYLTTTKQQAKLSINVKKTQLMHMPIHSIQFKKLIGCIALTACVNHKQLTGEPLAPLVWNECQFQDMYLHDERNKIFPKW